MPEFVGCPRKTPGIVSSRFVREKHRSSLADAAPIGVLVDHDYLSRKVVDGVGFDVARVTANGLSDSALGLRGMRERARAVSGVIEINSTLNAGTLVFASFPLNRGN